MFYDEIDAPAERHIHQIMHSLHILSIFMFVQRDLRDEPDLARQEKRQLAFLYFIFLPILRCTEQQFESQTAWVKSRVCVKEKQSMFLGFKCVIVRSQWSLYRFTYEVPQDSCLLVVVESAEG